MVTFSTFVQEILLRWVVCNFPSVADILCAWKTHIENYLFKQKSCMFNPYELVVYLEKYLVAGATVPLQSNEYNRCRNTDESIAELSVLQCGSCKSVCLFVQFSFSPVVTERYLQALSICKMPPMAVFPSDTLPLCRSVEYFTPASTLVLWLSVSSFTGFLQTFITAVTLDWWTVSILFSVNCTLKRELTVWWMHDSATLGGELLQ